MDNMKKKLFISILILACFSTIFTIHHFSTRIVYNEDTAIGNYSGNLLNEGLVCEYKNRIYFSNLDEQGTLYSMDSNGTDVKKVYIDKASFINVYGNSIYYARRNNTLNDNVGSFFAFNRTGMYRINLDGTNITPLYDKATGLLALSGNQVLYQHYSTEKGLELYKVNIDAKEEKKLSDEPILPYVIHDEKLYYIGAKSEHNIHVMDLKNYTSKVLKEGNFSHLILNNNYLYFWDLDNNRSITKMKLDGTQTEVVVSNTDKCSSYNVNLSGKYLYYQIDDGSDSKICRKDLQNGDVRVLMKGNFCNIQVTNNYVFFREANTDTMYWMENSKNATISVFHPDELK